MWLMQVHATPTRVVEGRFEFGVFTFVLGAGLLLGLTVAGLLAARYYRESRDARLSASVGTRRADSDGAARNPRAVDTGPVRHGEPRGARAGEGPGRG